MAHDYAKKNPPRQASVTRNKPSADASAGKPWRYFVLGVICTLLVEGLVYWLNHDKAEKNITQQAKQQVKAIQQKAKEPNYTFYQDLPEQKVEVNVAKLPEPEDVAYNYVLQAGAYKDKSQAEQQRAEITLMGFSVSIDTSVNKAGNTWYRVIVGPFESRSALNKARNTLADKHITTFTLSKKSL